MPPATNQKTPESHKKLPFEFPNSVESEKSVSEFGSKPLDCTSRPTGGAGETVTKRPVRRTSKPDEEKTGKKVNSACVDRVPKKSAQRVKGSTSLNKSIEKSNAEPTEKKRPPVETLDKSDNEKSGMEGKKVTKKQSRTKTGTKRPIKRESRIPRTPQAWLNSKQKQNCEVEEKVEEIPEPPQEEIRNVNGPFSSCSFFEKIQQGVKAYFSSRNSFTPGEKNKKEGGRQNRAHGVTEDATKREPGFVLKNKISDSFSERLRVNSSLGGELSNFSSGRPIKIFRKLKRKKLYRPKKHCVRIQIPRKGYFYRSTVQFKAPEPTSSGQFDGVDPTGVPKDESKVQISGMATASSKKSDLPHKKRLKRKKPSSKAFDWPKGTNRHFVEELAEGERQKSRIGCDVSERESVLGDSFETLVSCLNSTLDEDLIYDLEITPVSKMETVFAYNTTITESPLMLTDMIKAFESPEPTSAKWGVEERHDPFNPTAYLMEGIDLHFELQNYLKAFDSRSYFPDPANCTSEFEEMSEISTFESATSIPEILVMHERETASASEECITGAQSQTEIKPDFEPTALSPQPKSIIKRTFGKTSFEKLQLEDEWFSRILSPLKELSMKDSNDSYEKILPLFNSNSESKPKEKSDFLYENIVYSHSDESLTRNIRKVISDSSQSQVTTTDATRTVQSSLLMSSSSERTIANSNSKWSPTLQDLIEIYDSIIKQHKRIKSSGRPSISNRISTHLISFLNKKIEEKQLKADLIKLSKDFTSSYTSSNQWKPFKGNNSIKGYVNKFQELLQSPLTIKQITRVNKIISNLQDSSKNKQTPREGKQIRKVKTKQTPKKQSPKKQKPTSAPKTPNTPKPSSPPRGKMQNVKLPAPKDLDLMLRSSFNSKGVVCTDPDLTDVKNKVLVTVKLRGNRVMVNGLTYFDSESVLKSNKKPKGTSELIIENVTKEQINGFWYKKTKSSKLREQINSRGKTKKSEKKAKKSKPRQKTAKQAKPTKPTKPKTPVAPVENQRQQDDELESFLQFHYDQMLLRTQHPIDAIIESSESKISGLVEEAKTKERPEVDEKSVKEALTEKEFSKEFFWNFRWMDEEGIDTSLVRTKSSIIRRQTEQRQSPMKKKKRAEAVQSMIELQKTERPIFPRPRTAYLCFPAASKQQKPWKDKKPTGCCVSRPKTPQEMSKSSSNTVLYLNSDNIPECCSIELLFSEDNENASTSSKVSVAPEVSEPVSQQESSHSIVFHSRKREMADFSFPSMIIRSDSFLKSIQHSGVERTDLESLFKSNSDMKFFPGRLTDSGADVKPFVTFVLTPEQQAAAGLSDNQVQVVRKAVVNKDIPVDDTETEEETDYESEDSRSEISIPLASIENFINELSKCRAKVASQQLNRLLNTKPKSKPKPTRAQSTPIKPVQKKKALLGQMSQIIQPTSRKSVREQKPLSRPNKKPTAKSVRKPPARIVKKSPAGFKKPQQMVKEKPGKKRDTVALRSKPTTNYMGREPEVSEILKNAINNFSKVMGSPQRPKLLEEEVLPVEEPKSEPPASNIPTNMVEVLKTAISQAEDFPNKPEIVAAIEKAFEKPETLNERPDPMKKLKVVKIKILCNEHKILKNGGNLRERKDGGNLREWKDGGNLREWKDRENLREWKDRENLREWKDGGNLREWKDGGNLREWKDGGNLREWKDGGNLREWKDAGNITEFFPLKERTPPPPPPPTPVHEFAIQTPQTSPEIKLLDSLVVKEREGEGEGNDLERKKSTYFDAVERSLREDGAGEEIGDRPKDQMRSRDEHLLKVTLPGEVETEPEELLLHKITESLKEEDITYAIALLDVFLNKTDSFSFQNSAKLKKLLLLIESKSKNLMLKIERNVWVKVLTLLEEVSRLLENEDVELKKSHIQTAKDFVERIQQLNTGRLLDLQNFCCSLSRPPVTKTPSNVFGRIRDSLKFLTRKFSLRRWEMDSSDSDSQLELKVHSTVSLPEIREAFAKKTELERLKRKIQQQKTCIEQLIESDTDSVPPEIQDVKDKVADKVKRLERMFADYDIESSKGKKGWWKREEPCSSFDKDQDLRRRSAYADLMQCLMKVWDTRMSFNSCSSECYS